jgi:hypothetical protein
MLLSRPNRVVRLKRLIIVILSAAAAAFLFWTPTVVATADLHNGRTVELMGKSLFGFHSDWNRKLVISDGRTEAEMQLYEDTGWWRGSALYRDSKGAFFFDDGIEYVRFTLCPPKFATITRTSTDGIIGLTTALSEVTCDVTSFEPTAPLSQFRSKKGEYYFIGMFVETHPGLAFRWWHEIAEPSPDSLSAGG